MLIEKITAHPLKDIVLKYDDQKEVTDFERDLLKDYVKLHDGIYRFYPERDNLLELFKNIDEHVINGEDALAKLANGIESFHARAVAMINEKGTSAIEGRKLMREIELFYPQIEKFHEQYMDGLREERNSSSDVNKAFADEYFQFRKDYLNPSKIGRAHV